jgi:hypothetical protein
MTTIRTAPVATVAALALGLLLSGVEPALAQEKGCNQGRVAAIAESFAAEAAKLDKAAKNLPPDITFSQQRAQYQLEEDIRMLKNTSSYLAKQLRAGKGREETRPAFKRLEGLVSSAEENARKTLVQESFMDQIFDAGAVLLQLRPYYREEAAKPKEAEPTEAEPEAGGPDA